MRIALIPSMQKAKILHIYVTAESFVLHFHSMATFFIFLALSLLYNTAEAQQKQTNVSPGSSLTPNTNSSSWRSPSGLYAFGFYRQGNGYAVGIFVAGIAEKTVVWTANRDDPPVASHVTLLLTRDGNLVLRQPEGEDITVVEPEDPKPISSASMLDSGNFVLYGSGQDIIWQSFDHPTDTILPGQRLTAGQELLSSVTKTDHSAGIFGLKLQSDGNLVQYPMRIPLTPEDSYWASDTSGLGDKVTLNFGDSGHLYLLNGNVNVQNITGGEEADNTNKDKIFLMRIDTDGIFRVYSHTSDPKGNWSILWESTSDKCSPKGLCGLNGYCVPMDEEVNCKCLPGFDFVIPGNWTSGCARSFTAESCKTKQGITKYTMVELENTVWESEAAYLQLSLPKMEDCKQSCFEDCNCEAAIFKDGRCRKQRLPLRYGKRSRDDHNIALIKVGSNAPNLNENIPPVLPPREVKKMLRENILIICVTLASFSFIALAISGFLLYKAHVKAYRKIPRNIELGEDFSPQAFTFAELEQVTNGFKQELGRGAFGTVYKGIIPHNQKVVAVKKLEKVSQGEIEFRTEIRVILRTHHRNLVRLIGYCIDGPNRLLVYEFMSNGSLADFLFKPENQLTWDERMVIARHIARGIFYLHEECETQIVHCDIKPQNILIDEQGRAKISDFGLAKLLKPDHSKTTFTGIRGTRGYVAPEWHRKQPVTAKVDVYSFGVVLFEILCCRKSLDWSLPEEEAVLEEWIYSCFEENEVGKLVGDEEVDKRKLEEMVKIGLWCIQDEPFLRPSMKKVLLMLEGTVDIPVPPDPTSSLKCNVNFSLLAN